MPDTSFTLSFPVFSESLQPGSTSLLSFVQQRFARTEPAELIGWIASGRVRVDQQLSCAEQRLAAGQTVQVTMPDHREDPVDTSWQLVWQNEEIMAVYKPPLLPVSRTTRNLYNTLIQLVRRQSPYYDAHLLHRLDTETDGLILIAKDKAADLKWKKQLASLIERKIYQARVHGQPDWNERTFECELSEREGSAIRSQMYVVDPTQPEQYKKPKLSKTAFRVLRTEGACSLLECELFTGRKHQIRSQLAHLGHPVVGDKIYAHQGHYYLKRLEVGLTGEDIELLGAPHHQLTAVRLELRLGPDSELVCIELN